MTNFEWVKTQPDDVQFECFCLCPPVDGEFCKRYFRKEGCKKCRIAWLEAERNKKRMSGSEADKANMKILERW